MKKALCKRLLLFTAALATITLQSCVRDTNDEYNCEDQIFHLSFSDEDKAQIPFKENDTFNMASNTGDTFQFVSKGKQTDTTYSFERYPNPACGNHGRITSYDNYILIFKSNKDDSINVTISRQGSLISVEFRKRKFRIEYYGISNKNYGDIKLYDSLNINGKTHYLVSEYTSLSDTILLNEDNGLIRISLNNPNLILERL